MMSKSFGATARAALTLCVLGAGALITCSSALAAYVDVVRGDSPTAYLRLGEPQGATVAVDSSGFGRNGTYAAGAISGVAGALDPDADTAAAFNNSDGVCPVAPWYEEYGETYTAEAWIRDLGPGVPEPLIGQTSDGQTPDWLVSIGSDGSLVGQIFSGKWTYTGTAAGTESSLDDGSWHYVAAIFSGSQISLYADGVPLGNSTTTSLSVPWGRLPAETYSPLGVCVGATAGSRSTAEIDEAAIYSGALTAAQIANHYGAGIAGPDTSDEPVLSSQDQQRAISVAESDPRVASILSGTSSAVSGAVAWTKTNGVNIGAVVDFTWGAAKTVEADWPGVLYDESEGGWPPYQTVVDHYTATNVMGLSVTVDLGCNAVVGVDPDDAAAVTNYSNVSGPVAAAPCAPDPPSPTWHHNIRLISLGPDAFWNYDFHDQTTDAHGKPNSKYDMPVTMIFWGNAFAEPVRLAVFNNNDGFRSPENELLSEGSGWTWITNSGAKDGQGLCWTDTHIRLYQDPNPRYNPYYGYFVVGTTHYDHDENEGIIPFCSDTWYGKPDDAAHSVAKRWESTYHDGAQYVRENKMFINNRETSHREGNHKYANDGKATLVKVCMSNDGRVISCTLGY